MKKVSIFIFILYAALSIGCAHDSRTPHDSSHDEVKWSLKLPPGWRDITAWKTEPKEAVFRAQKWIAPIDSDPTWHEVLVYLTISPIEDGIPDYVLDVLKKRYLDPWTLEFIVSRLEFHDMYIDGRRCIEYVTASLPTDVSQLYDINLFTEAYGNLYSVKCGGDISRIHDFATECGQIVESLRVWK